jgi:hypothetical protein
VPRRALAALIAATAALGGCGEPASVPAGCLAGPDAIAAALETAPEPVRLEGTPISACVAAAGPAGQVEAVGGALVDVAARLADRVAHRHDSAAATRLGYLAGAVERGAGDPPGVHAELLRRLDQELERVDARSPAYREGRSAGARSG